MVNRDSRIRPKYSVVIPCYNSNHTIIELLNRIRKFLEKIDPEFEVICVDDASTDNVSERIKEYRQDDQRIQLIRFHNNCGQHVALMTGFRFASGEYIITIDDDLQNPPEEIEKLIEALNENDVVFGVPDIKHHKEYRNLGSRAIRKVLKIVFKPPKGFASSSFRLMRKSIADQLAATKTTYPYISGMILRITKNVSSVSVRHDKRMHGKSGYTLSKQFLLTSNLLINYTKLPLQFLISIALSILIITFGLIIYLIVKKLFFAEVIPGWTSLAVLISFFGGINLLAFAIVGEYIIRILNELSGVMKPVLKEVLTSKRDVEEGDDDSQ